MDIRFKLCMFIIVLSFVTSCGNNDTSSQTVQTITPLPSIEDTNPAVTATRTPKPTSTSPPPPDLSPFSEIGGGMIAYISNRDGDNEIYLMVFPTAVSGPVVEYQLTDNDADDSVPDWSPDGKQIAFSSTRDGNWEIYVMDVEITPENAEAGNIQRLTNDEGDDLSPAWSPDGTQIAFSSDRDGDWEIYVMNANGNNIRQVTDNDIIDSKPTWSPDGGKIGFDSGEGYNRDIFIMDKDGSNQELVVQAGGGWPAWSPDGNQIAFFGRLAGNPEIYTVNVDGTSQTRMTFNYIDDWEPSWSPDGEWLLYVSGTVTDVYIMRVDKSESYQLTNDRSADWTPVWRPTPP